jgi:uncharacterized membrane protein YdbT with pleckstrin-like domain
MIMANSYIDRLMASHERIILVSRQHWFLLVRSILVEISAMLVLIAIGIIFAVNLPHLAALSVAVIFLLIMFPIATMTRDILEWTNRQYIVTNRRVIQIFGIINKNIIDSSLDKVNDVKMEQSVLGRLFGYGDIEILTASEYGINQFNKIADPIDFKTAMLNAKEHMESEARPSLKNDKSDIPSMIKDLYDLKERGLITEEEYLSKKNNLLSKI